MQIFKALFLSLSINLGFHNSSLIELKTHSYLDAPNEWWMLNCLEKFHAFLFKAIKEDHVVLHMELLFQFWMGFVTYFLTLGIEKMLILKKMFYCKNRKKLLVLRIFYWIENNWVFVKEFVASLRKLWGIYCSLQYGIFVKLQK